MAGNWIDRVSHRRGVWLSVQTRALLRLPRAALVHIASRPRADPARDPPDTMGSPARITPVPTLATTSAPRELTDVRYPSGQSKTAIQPAVNNLVQDPVALPVGVNRRHASPGPRRASRMTVPTFVTMTIR